MGRRIWFILLITVMLLTGCTGKGKTQKLNSGSGKDRDTFDEVYAIIMKSQGNTYNELTAAGYQEVIESFGAQCIVKYPKSATAEDQIILINELIQKDVDSISVAANDVNALESILNEAMAADIKVSTLDSNTNAESRMVFVNQVSAEEMGQKLLEAVYDISGGSGQWAILSATSQATNQNEWIYAMKEAMEDEKYNQMRLVTIVYGDDDPEISADKTRELLATYPELKVICVPSANGIAAAAKVVAAEYPPGKVKLTGLGLPSQMASYIGDGEEDICPYMYLWNPMDVGRLSAYVAMALVNGEIKGEAGETFTAGDMGEFVIRECPDGGTEVIVGDPLKFDSGNIEVWRDIF